MLTQMSLPPMMNSLLQQLQLQQQQLQQRQQTQPLNLPQIAAPTLLAPISCAAPISVNNPQGRGLTSSQNDLRKLWQLQFQSRWIGKAWHIKCIVALGDWTFHFRTWNLLKSIYDTPVGTCIHNDDLLGFKQLMASGRYTMCDRERHWTMFQVRTARSL